MKKLIGPFRFLVTMRNLSLKGALQDTEMEIIQNAGIVIQGTHIEQVGNYEEINKTNKYQLEKIDYEAVVLPGFIDAHTHICYAGSRAADFTKRLSGKTYLQIAEEGGGIWNTVQQTRKATFAELKKLTAHRAKTLLQRGITTVEIKSGYGLNIDDELKMLRVINELSNELAIDLVPTCLAAHVKPKDFVGTNNEYLKKIVTQLLPIVKTQQLAKRVDVFVEKGSFSYDEAKKYLQKAREMGFQLIVHADQFSTGGSRLSVEFNAYSADHLEASEDKEIKELAASETAAIVLPGASLGTGGKFAPARKLLNAGASLIIASDWNPGSAPNGDLLLQASILATYEHLTPAEVFAAMTFRAAHALELADRGTIEKGKKADFIAFNCNDYKEIIYRQGKLKPKNVWKNGVVNGLENTVSKKSKSKIINRQL